MIRQPTPLAVQYGWWRKSLSGQEPPRHEGYPECGWYKYRAVKNGPFLPVRIWLEQEIDSETGELCADERLRCVCLGARRDPEAIWTYLRPISRAAYDELERLHRDIDQMAATHAPFDVTAITHTTQPQLWSNI